MIIFTNEDTDVSIYSGNVGIMGQEFSGSLNVFMAMGENKRFFEGGSDVELLVFLLSDPMYFPIWCHDSPPLFLKFWVLFLEMVTLKEVTELFTIWRP